MVAHIGEYAPSAAATLCSSSEGDLVGPADHVVISAGGDVGGPRDAVRWMTRTSTEAISVSGVPTTAHSSLNAGCRHNSTETTVSRTPSVEDSPMTSESPCAAGLAGTNVLEVSSSTGLATESGETVRSSKEVHHATQPSPPARLPDM